jgi:hypothetical protein
MPKKRAARSIASKRRGDAVGTHLQALASAFWTGLFALGVLVAPPEAQAQPLEQTSDEEIVDNIMVWMRAVFALSPSAPLDREIRDAASLMAEEHLERLPALFRTWLADEPRGATMSRRQLLHARAANELAVWRLQSAGPEHDSAWLATMERPTMCRQGGLGESYFERLALMWQSAPVEQRSTLLASENLLLKRWGLPVELPARPVPSATDALGNAIERLKTTGARGPVPMPPVVATTLLKEGAPWRALTQHDGCAALQWGLLNELAAATGKRDAALQTWRYAMMPGVDLWFPETASAPKKANDSEYPRLALTWQIEGRITVEVGPGRDGTGSASRIVARDIKVPGIRGTRPVAFETALDEASLARADALDTQARAERRRVEFVWKLQ